MVVVAGQVRRDTIAPIAVFRPCASSATKKRGCRDGCSDHRLGRARATPPCSRSSSTGLCSRPVRGGRPRWLERPGRRPGRRPSRCRPVRTTPVTSTTAGTRRRGVCAGARPARRRPPAADPGRHRHAPRVTESLVPLAEALGVPVATGWTHDTIPSDHPLFAGRPGTIGTRAGNFIAQTPTWCRARLAPEHPSGQLQLARRSLRRRR